MPSRVLRAPGPVAVAERGLRRRTAVAVTLAYLTSPLHLGAVLVGAAAVCVFHVLVSGFSVWTVLAINVPLLLLSISGSVAVVVYLTPRRRGHTLWAAEDPSRGVSGVMCIQAADPSTVKLASLGAWPKRRGMGRLVATAAANHVTQRGQRITFFATRRLSRVYEENGFVRLRSRLFGVFVEMGSKPAE